MQSVEVWLLLKTAAAAATVLPRHQHPGTEREDRVTGWEAVVAERRKRILGVEAADGSQARLCIVGGQEYTLFTLYGSEARQLPSTEKLSTTVLPLYLKELKGPMLHLGGRASGFAGTIHPSEKGLRKTGGETEKEPERFPQPGRQDVWRLGLLPGTGPGLPGPPGSPGRAAGRACPQPKQTPTCPH